MIKMALTRKDYNVIFLLVDSLRKDHLGCYGYAKDTSPNVDNFARDCVIFSNATAQGNATLPSIPSFLTGLYPKQHGCINEKTRLEKSTPTIATMLKKEGYCTAAFTGGGYLSKEFGFDNGFDVFKSNGYSIEKTAKQAMDFIECCKEPFFVFIHCFDVHHPFEIHKQFVEKFSLGGTEVKTTKKDFQNISEGKVKLTEVEKEEVIKRYDNEIAFFDLHFGKFIEFLKKRNLYNSSIIILTADHGEEFFDHGKIGTPEDNLYEELVNVPLLLKAPGLLPKKEKRLVRGIDVLPTVFGLLNKRMSSDVDGINLVGYVKFERALNLRAFINVELDLRSISMIKTNDFKLIKREFKREKIAKRDFLKFFPRYVLKFLLLFKSRQLGKSILSNVEFFDLQKDKKERKNLGLRVKEAEPLLKELNEWLIKMRAKKVKYSEIPKEEETRRQLVRLGYLE